MKRNKIEEIACCIFSQDFINYTKAIKEKERIFKKSYKRLKHPWQKTILAYGFGLNNYLEFKIYWDLCKQLAKIKIKELNIK